MKKILPNKSLKNRRLRERNDLSELEKTALHRWHYQNSNQWEKWQALLSVQEWQEVKKSIFQA